MPAARAPGILDPNEAQDAALLNDLPDDSGAMSEEDAVEEVAEEAPASGRASRPSERSARAGAGRSEKALRASSRRGGRASEKAIPTTSARLRRKKGEEEEKAAEAEEALDDRASRRSRRVSMRERKPPAPFLSKKMKILLAFVALLIVAGVIAYKPVMMNMYIGGIQKGDENAARSLWEWRRADAPEVALKVFEDHIKGQADEAVLKAAAFGVTAAAKDSSKGAFALVADVLKTGSDAERRVLAESALQIAEHWYGKWADAGRDDNKRTVAQKQMEELAPPLVERVTQDKDPAVRLASIKALGKLPAKGGGCAVLLDVAKQEQGATREAALQGIEMSAMPDSVGKLLIYMPDADEALARAARAGFAKVRDQAAVGDLVPLLDNDNAEVRLEIVKALGLRKGNEAAGDGIVKAFKDKDHRVRTEAVKAVPNMTLGVDELKKLDPLVEDVSEEVRLALAETIKAQRDDVTWRICLESFSRGVTGKTLAAMVEALGIRGRARKKDKGRKDMEAIGVVMDSMEKHPEASATIGRALVELTALANKPAREKERALWSREQWKSWYDNLAARQKIEDEAMKLLHDADKQKADIDKYPELAKQAEKGLDLLDKCVEMSKPHDEEDIYIFEGHIKIGTELRYQFMKNQRLNMGR